MAGRRQQRANRSHRKGPQVPDPRPPGVPGREEESGSAWMCAPWGDLQSTFAEAYLRLLFRIEVRQVGKPPNDEPFEIRVSSTLMVEKSEPRIDEKRKSPVVLTHTHTQNQC